MFNFRPRKYDRIPDAKIRVSGGRSSFLMNNAIPIKILLTRALAILPGHGNTAALALTFLLFLQLFPMADVRTAHAALARKDAVQASDLYNPHPDAGDILLPMPGGLKMAFRLAAVPARGILWDMPLRPGRDDIANPGRAYYDRRFSAALSAPFTLADLPESWRAAAPQDGSNCFFYLIAKYEVSRGQWRSVMDADFSSASITADDARPQTGISWYEAVDFTRRYTQWLLKKAPDALPRFAHDKRNIGFLRLPTETEWEYAARGGQNIGSQQLLQEDFFPFAESCTLNDYAVFRQGGTFVEHTARIGSRKPNPLGLYDTAGNVAEMCMDMFRFSIGGRLHGSAGGIVRKGGSYLSDAAAVMPGRREESPFFLVDGPASAQDLGFRPVLTGINTPGGNRPEELAAAWLSAGEQPASPLPAARNPLEELDRLLAQAPNDAVKANLQQLRATLKENNIIVARQKQLEAESLLRTGVYMIETIRNYASRQKALENQRDNMAADAQKTQGDDKARLLEIIALADRGLEQCKMSLNKSLSFYISKVAETCALDEATFTDALAQLEKDFAGQDPFNETMRRNLAIFREHAGRWRKGTPLARAAVQSQLLEGRFQ